jgi:uncharacterized damage-inducible protein DinB
MAADYTSTDAFRGASFHGVDLSGATFRDCSLAGARITGSDIGGLRVSGYVENGAGVLVDEVDVTAFVRSELDRRHPERVLLRGARTAQDFRTVWETVDRLWSQTLARAERLPVGVRHQRVDGEWSVAETLRHLVFAVDVWLGRMIQGHDRPFHSAGLPPTDYPAAGAADLGIDLTARPSYAESVAMHAERGERVRAFLATVTVAELAEVRTGAPAPAWGTESYPVRECVRVLLDEHIEHRRFAERDLAVLEGRGAAGS